MEYLAIIPARGGSKGLPQKNVKSMLGKPLIAWTIQQALETEQIDHTVVTTDNHRIAKVSEAFGARVPFRRPPELSGDKSTIERAMLHCLAWHEKIEEFVPDAVILLQCTTPLRRRGRIAEAIEQFESSGVDCLVGVSPVRKFLWEETAGGAPRPLYDPKHQPRRHDIKAPHLRYVENGSIYIIKTNVFIKQKSRVAGKVCLFKMSEEEGHEIKTAEEFEFVQLLMHALNRQR